MPKLLWVGDAVVATGFSRCTHKVCDYLHSVGWDVNILGINYFGDPHSYPYMIYPSLNPSEGGHDLFGEGRLPRLIDQLKPDIVVILQDPWNIKSYFDKIDQYSRSRSSQGYGSLSLPPIVGWIAVDGENQKAESLNRLSHVITWTRFGSDQLRLGGYSGNSSIIPLAVDHELYYPRDREVSRQSLPGIEHASRYIVGVVGRNQPRKRIDLSIQYFAEWIDLCNVPDACLYLYVGPTGEYGCDIRSILEYYNLTGKVIVCEPPVGKGCDESYMPYIYSSFNCLLSTTQGEGWGLTAMEAMACGAVPILPGWSAYSEWAQGGAIIIPCTSRALSAPWNHTPYTIGGIADKSLTIEALDRLYRDERLRSEYSQRGIDLVKRYSWNSIGQDFDLTLRSLLLPKGDF